MSERQAIRLSVYRRSQQDFSNNGITHTNDDILVLCDEGPIKIDMSNPPENLMRLSLHTVGKKPTVRLIPLVKSRPGLIGPMMGGCYASSSDARWHRLLASVVGETCAYLASAVPIHDRYETPEQYELLSR
jgi:hypothetical protein